MAMDPMDIEIKFRKTNHGTIQCYSDDCAGLTGEGPNESAAANHFWKNFNKTQDTLETQARKKRKDEAVLAAKKAA